MDHGLEPRGFGSGTLDPLRLIGLEARSSTAKAVTVPPTPARTGADSGISGSDG
jgi:hypothetical protein